MHSHIYTVFRNGEVDIRPIEFNEQGITLSKWLSSDTWYQKNTTSGFFLWLNNKDIEEMYHGIGKLNMPEPTEEFQFGHYTVFIFERIHSMFNELK